MHINKLKKYYIYYTIFTLTILSFLPNTIVTADENDLIIQDPTLTEPIIEDQPYTITTIIKNTGNDPIPQGTNLSTHLYINNAGTPETINWTEDGLSAKASRYLNLTWTPSLTDTTIIIILYCDGIFIDDVYLPITVQEKNTDIILNALNITGTKQLNEQLTILGNATNTGKNTTKRVYATLIINNQRIQNQSIPDMTKNQSHNFSFKWTPTQFGYYTINITLDPENTIEESNESNNYQEHTIFIDPYQIDWYSPNWHYRKLYTINGTGTIQLPINFTQLLNNLSVTQHTFENNTILPIIYHPDGTINQESPKYTFNQSNNYHPQNNANGILTLTTINPISYVCIYFDVSENTGNRTATYTPNLQPTPNMTYTDEIPAEGWWATLTLPDNNFYPLNLPSTIKATTIAYATTTTATLYYEGTFETTLTLNTTNQLTWKQQYTFTKKGTWQIEITSQDTAGYNNPPLISENISVDAIPDLSITTITLPTKNITEGTPTNIKTTIKNNGTVDAINYEIRLYISQNLMRWDNTYLRDNTTINISKKDSKTITLTWDPSIYGPTSNNGQWIVGIWIITDNQHPDFDTSNNKKIRSPLTIEQGEQDPPQIQLIDPQTTIEQSLPYTIQAIITDASGIDKTNLTITNPRGLTQQYNLTTTNENTYSFIYNSTTILGKYSYKITATDNSFYQKQTTITNDFTVIQDKTAPTIEFTGIFPKNQLQNTDITFICIAHDFNEINLIDIELTDPDEFSQTLSMTQVGSTNKYRKTEQFSTSGQYSFKITIQDQARNSITTDTYTFWITSDLNDTDDDGMPDTWETRYGLNPYDPTDASKDLDKDSITNLEEYRQQTNPTLEPTFAQEFALQLQDNASYLAFAIIMSILIIIISIYIYTRR